MDAVTFGSWEDLFALPGFTEHLPAEVMKTGTLSRSYSMPNRAGERQCGIAECGTLHRNGYVIEFVDGRCSHVGRHCGRKHFGASAWKIQLRALKRKVEDAAAAEALLQAKDDAISAIETVKFAPTGLDRALALLSKFDRLPGAVRYDLERRAETGNSDVVRTREPSEAERKRARFYGQPVPTETKTVVGKITELGAISRAGRVDSATAALNRLAEQLNACVQRSDATAMELVELRSRLLAVYRRLPLAIDRTFDFFSKENLKQVALIPGGEVLRAMF